MSNYDNIPANLAAILNGNFNQAPVVTVDPNEPTEEQRKLSDELVDMLSDLYAAEGAELAPLADLARDEHRDASARAAV